MITIHKAVDAARSCAAKKALIETFIAGINDVDDVMLEWRAFVTEEKERQLSAIIREENLKDAETRKFIEASFRDGSVKRAARPLTSSFPQCPVLAAETVRKRSRA